MYDGAADTAAQAAYVVVEGQHVTDVGNQQSLAENAAEQFSRCIELPAGTTLLPGLINMHTHLSFSASADVFELQLDESDATKMIRIVENMHAALSVGITTVRDCGTWPHLALPARDAVESGLLAGPRLITSGAVTTTGGHCWFCATEADSKAEIRKAVREHTKSGVDFIKLFATGGASTPGSNSLLSQYSTEELCAATEEARRAGKRTAAHAHATDGVRNAITARVTSIEHCSFLSEAGMGWEADMVDEIVDAGIYVCPTVFRGANKFLDDPAIIPPDQVGQHRDRLQQRFALTNRLWQHGVQIVSGNDAGVAHCHITDFPGDIIATVEGAGLTPIAVLQSVGTTAAQALGRKDIGVIEAGRVADLLVVSGDPTTNIHAIAEPEMVFARGEAIYG
jgi:imidazolonepropionase-like amidohydrolase